MSAENSPSVHGAWFCFGLCLGYKQGAVHAQVYNSVTQVWYDTLACWRFYLLHNLPNARVRLGCIIGSTLTRASSPGPFTKLSWWPAAECGATQVCGVWLGLCAVTAHTCLSRPNARTLSANRYCRAFRLRCVSFHCAPARLPSADTPQSIPASMWSQFYGLSFLLCARHNPISYSHCV